MIRRPNTQPNRRRFRVFVALETVVIALGIGFLVLGRAGFVGSPISYVVVSGHSMEPTFHLGDVVVLRQAASYHKGDVLGYKVPAGSPGAGLIIIHRVIGCNARDGYIMQGDNKKFADPWRPRPGDVVGQEALMVPKIGLAIRYIRSPLGFAALAGLITITIALGGGKPGDSEAPGGTPEPQTRAARERGVARRGGAVTSRRRAPATTPAPPIPARPRSAARSRSRS
jgi:signal peptidase